MMRADPDSVPHVHEHASVEGRGFVAYGFIMDKMTNLMMRDIQSHQKLVRYYPTPLQFTRRMLYLLGLCATNGIIHGARGDQQIPQ
jgi:hypothetical protein